MFVDAEGETARNNDIPELILSVLVMAKNMPFPCPNPEWKKELDREWSSVGIVERRDGNF